MAKNEALDNIFSLFKQNIKSCNAKRRRQRGRTVKKQQKDLISKKKQLCTCSTRFCTYLCQEREVQKLLQS